MIKLFLKIVFASLVLVYIVWSMSTDNVLQGDLITLVYLCIIAAGVVVFGGGE